MYIHDLTAAHRFSNLGAFHVGLPVPEISQDVFNSRLFCEGS